MTNEVEKLILDTHEKPKLEYSDLIAYNFYKEIWKFLLFANDYDYNEIKINFNILKRENNYVSKCNGINYEVIGEGFKYTWKTFYDGCEDYYIESILNTNINDLLLKKLLKKDNFNVSVIENSYLKTYNINISKTQVLELIDYILIKNKVLNKTKRVI